MQHFATGVTIPDDTVLFSWHSRTLYDQANGFRGTNGKMGREGIDNHYIALLHLSDPHLASDVAMLHIEGPLELIKNFVVGVNMKIIASVRPFDDHEDEVSMPKDFFIAY